jgi:hypothetical protein
MELVYGNIAQKARRDGTVGKAGTAKCRSCGYRIHGTGIKHDGMWFHTTWDECTDPLRDNRDDTLLTVLRGVVEAGDPARYFHSTMAVRHWTEKTIERGWLAGDANDLLKGEYSFEVTEAGREAYEKSGIKDFPTSYHQFWRWERAKAVRPLP